MLKEIEILKKGGREHEENNKVKSFYRPKLGFI